MNVRMSVPTVKRDTACRPLTAGRTPPADEVRMASNVYHGGRDPTRFRNWHPLCTIVLCRVEGSSVTM